MTNSDLETKSKGISRNARIIYLIKDYHAE